MLHFLKETGSVAAPGFMKPEGIVIFHGPSRALFKMTLDNNDGAKGHAYEVVNLDTNPERQAEALALSSALTVPVTVVTKHDDSKEVVIGFNLAKLAPALG